MKERNIPSFNLLPDSESIKSREWLSIALSKGRSVLVGNPAESQFVAIYLTNYTNTTAEVIISQKNGEDRKEQDIKHDFLELGQPYKLENENFVILCSPNRNPNFRNIIMSFSKPNNVDAARAELLEKHAPRS